MSLRLHNLTVSYHRRPAVHHLSGEFVLHDATVIFGPNGAGKSTLLKTMMGAIQPDAGLIENSFSRRATAYLPQQNEIDRSMPLSVRDLVAYGLWRGVGLFCRVGEEDWKKVQQVLHQVGLAEFSERPIAALSSGQFQRALFARILLQDARLILLDEPFNAMDARTTADLLHLIAIWQREKRTVIAVVHDCEQARSYFPNALLLAREKIAWGKSSEVLTDKNIKLANERMMHWQDCSEWCER